MSDTNVDKIKTQVDLLIQDVINGTVIRQENYNYLYSTSKTLFDFIIREVKCRNFNKERFELNLNVMLNNILKIQKNELTQNDASEIVGELVAKQFIPQLQ